MRLPWAVIGVLPDNNDFNRIKGCKVKSREDRLSGRIYADAIGALGIQKLEKLRHLFAVHGRVKMVMPALFNTHKDPFKHVFVMTLK